MIMPVDNNTLNYSIKFETMTTSIIDNENNLTSTQAIIEKDCERFFVGNL